MANKGAFGLRWLLEKCNVYPNAFYNFLKQRKAKHRLEKSHILAQIEEIYHSHNGVDGYRKMKIYLQRRLINLSLPTVQKYMNGDLHLRAVVRRKKPAYQKSSPHKIFPYLLQRDFTTEGKNKKWATDFTYLYLADGSLHYNCTIIDLYDRSVVASITDNKMTTSLAVRTLKEAIRRQKCKLTGLILHSDQGSQFTSREFTSFCSSVGIIQSMSKAGCPYDNSPMERFFNTLKTELIYLFEFHSKEQLYKSVEEFAYIFYNHVRPHSFNDYMTPFQKRYF